MFTTNHRSNHPTILFTILFGLYVNSWYIVPDKAYILQPPFDYNEYVSLDLNPIGIIYSDAFRWILIADGALDGGEAILAGDLSFIEEFKSTYKQTNHDFLSFLRFSIRDWKKRRTGLAHCFNIIKKLIT